MTTLSKEQASTLSDALLAQNTKRSGWFHNFFSYVHPLYRFPELSALEPWQQARLIRSAGRLADKQLSVLLSWFFLVAAILAVAFMTLPPYQTTSTFLAIFVFLGIPAVLIRRSQVRRHVLVLLDKEKRD